jgi:adenylylsulfate kinase
MKILIYGLSGSGKSTLAKKLADRLNIPIINGDEVRMQFNDWDFSIDGRLRQAIRIKDISESYDLVILDFICPLSESRDTLNPDITILMDTIEECQYEDTNSIFEFGNPDIIISKFDYDVDRILERLLENS